MVSFEPTCLFLLFGKLHREYGHTCIYCIMVKHLIVMHFIHEHQHKANMTIVILKEFHWLNDFCPCTFNTMVNSKHKLLHSKTMV